MKKKRRGYLMAFMVFLAVEFFIAIFVHDTFVRPYVGDILVVVVLYCAVRVVCPEKCKLLPLWIFVFAVFVEALQFVDLVQLLGLEHHKFLRILIGSTFDIKDILCYGVGCIMLVIYERIVLQTR